jgi:hypothetical protein
MIELGKYNDLIIKSETTVGLQLSDDAGEEILLPTKHCPQDAKTGDMIQVFVHHDNEGKMVATTQKPKFTLGEFSLLQAKAIADGVGAFLAWGVDKDLMVPFREQKQKMEEDRWYIVYLDIDLETDRLYGSSRIERFLQNEIITVSENEAVEILIWKKTDLGFSVIVNNIHQGLIFENEIFSELNVGDKMTGYVKNIREDNKIDISLQAVGYENFNDANAEFIFKALEQNKGFLYFTDKSSPDEIYASFGMSKKAFKKAIGALYKMRRIKIYSDGIKLL